MFIDVNCCLGNWPFRRLDVRDASVLLRHMGAEGVDAALVSSIDAVFHNDPCGENEHLIETTASKAALHPVPVVNPRIRNWTTAVDRYLDTEKVRAVKLHPNYHRYRLDASFVDALAERLKDAGVPLMITLRMEDERFHHPLMQVPGVPAAEVRAFAERHPKLSVVVLNGYRNDGKVLRGLDNVYVDIAFVEYNKTIDDLCGSFSPDRVLYGSHTPLFVTRAASMKVAWSEVGDDAQAAIARGNAARLFGL